MEIFLKIWKSTKAPLNVIGTLCSIASFACVFMSDTHAVWWALGFLCVALFVLLVNLLVVLNKFLEEDKSGMDHRCIASFVNYKTDDCAHIEYEVHKLIQVKCSIMHKFDTGYKWSGKSEPQWESSLQEVERIEEAKEEGKYNKLYLAMKEPALYNETKVVHFKANIDDAEKVSLPYVELKVEYPTEYIQITVSLGYKGLDFYTPAQVERALIHTDVPPQYKFYESVEFDRTHKQYIYRLVNPKPGYFYKLSWVR